MHSALHATPCAALHVRFEVPCVLPAACRARIQCGIPMHVYGMCSPCPVPLPPNLRHVVTMCVLNCVICDMSQCVLYCLQVGAPAEAVRMFVLARHGTHIPPDNPSIWVPLAHDVSVGTDHIRDPVTIVTWSQLSHMYFGATYCQNLKSRGCVMGRTVHAWQPDA